jgi:type II secretory pathway component GspD/PulD (secretin)
MLSLSGVVLLVVIVTRHQFAMGQDDQDEAFEDKPVEAKPVPAREALQRDHAEARVEKPNGPDFLPALSPNERRIQDALNSKTEVAFADNPLQEALNYLEDLHHIEIWIDKQALTVEGVNADQPVSLVISGVTLQSALRLLLEPLGLTYLVEDEVLKITTQSKTSAKLITRTYPIGDLFTSRDDSAELVDALSCGLGLNPKGDGQPKPIVVSTHSAALIARLSRSQNDQLLQLLRDLRDARAQAFKGRGTPERG